jgi:transcriptional regulator with XRE-family HTH domain
LLLRFTLMPQTIAENLRRAMEAKRIDAGELARRLQYQNRAMVDHWLAGRRALSQRNLARVATALDVQVAEIDPGETAYTPSMRKARSAEKRIGERVKQNQPPPPQQSHVAAPPPLSTGADMGPGDQGLVFVQSVWGILTPELRQDLVEHARDLAHKATAPTGTLRKKANR